MKPGLTDRATLTGARNSLPRVTCARCAVAVVPVVYPSGPHLRADCPRCGRYLKFVPQNPTWLAMLKVRPVQGGLFEVPVCT